MFLHDPLTAPASTQADLLVLTSSFPRFHGDLSAPYLLELCRYLQLNCEKPIQVLFPADEKTCVAAQETGGVECHRFDYLPVRGWQKLAFGAGIPDNLMRFPWHIFQIPFFLNSFYRRAERLAANMDILHCHWIFPAGWVGALVKRKYPSLKLVISIHSSDLELLEKIPFGPTLFRWIAGYADHLTVVNSAQAEKVKRIMGELSFHKISVLPMGIERPASVILSEAKNLKTEILRQKAPQDDSLNYHSNLSNSVRQPKNSDNRFKILFMGRLVPIKGLRYLLKSCENLENIQILIAGDGPEKKKLEKRFLKNIKFLGPVAGKEKRELLSSVDLAVFPSIREIWRTEGTPVSMLEAMAHGVPVIASSVGGMKEIIRHGQNGLLVKEKNVKELRQAILNLQNNSELRTSLGAQAFADTVLYDWKKIAAQFHVIFSEVIKPRPDWIA